MPPSERDPSHHNPTPDPVEIKHDAAYLSQAMEDPRLRERATAAFGAMGTEYLQDLIINHARFNHPHTIRDDYGAPQQINYYSLELLLGVMPEYMTNAQQAGLSPDQAYGLVRTLLSAEGRSEWAMNDEPVVQLSRAFKHRIERSDEVEADDYAILHGLVADTASGEDNSVAVLDAYRALTRLGFSSAESNTLIRNELYTDSLVINHAIGVFNTLSVAEVNSELLIEVCRLIPGEDPQLYAIQASYMLLKDLIATVCPRQDMPPNDLLKIVRHQLAEGRTMPEIAQSFITSEKQTIKGDAEAYHPAERRNRHFIDKPGQLELAPLPYRTERSFSEGAADIGRIALHQQRYREPIGEGIWVFDPEASAPTWYSLGGETDVDFEQRTVRARYPLYPLGDLSRGPVLYHAHPVALEHVISPRHNSGTHPNTAVPAITKFLAAIPSRRDYLMVAELLRSAEYKGGGVRSFIAHGSGTTEYTFPNDPEALEAMSHHYQALRDNMLAGINWERMFSTRKWYGLTRGERKDRSEVVQELVTRFNRILPKDFQLRLLGPEVQVEL